MTMSRTDWLENAERVTIPLRRVSGAHVTIYLGRLPTGCYQVAVFGSAPGHTNVGKLTDDDVAQPNRFNAILLGIQLLKRAWSSVPALVADLAEAEERDL